MNLLLKLTTLVLVCSCITANAEDIDWFAGRLHKSTLDDWNRASLSNQLGTVADIVISTTNIKDPGDAKPVAKATRVCVNAIAKDDKMRTKKVSEATVICLIQLGYIRLNK